jgi:hypothetical protein
MIQENYFRIHSSEIAYLTGQPRGLFVTIWKLVEQKILTEAEIKIYWENRDYFERILPIPPFYEDNNSIKAITWFKNNKNGKMILNQLTFYFDMAKKYQVKLYQTTSEILPGKLVYEDHFQIGVIEPIQMAEKIKTVEIQLL